jgi:hypothetical protein
VGLRYRFLGLTPKATTCRPFRGFRKAIKDEVSVSPTGVTQQSSPKNHNQSIGAIHLPTVQRSDRCHPSAIPNGATQQSPYQMVPPNNHRKALPIDRCHPFTKRPDRCGPFDDSGEIRFQPQLPPEDSQPPDRCHSSIDFRIPKSDQCELPDRCCPFTDSGEIRCQTQMLTSRHGASR